MATEFTAEFEAYCETVAREWHSVRSGRSASPELGRIYDRYGYLGRPDEIASLDQTAASAFYERDRKAARMLAASACELALQASVHSLTEQIEAHASRASVMADGVPVRLRAAREAIARNPRREARESLLAESCDRVDETNDLRAERLEKRADTATKLGAASELDLVATRRDVDLGQLARRAEGFLAATEQLYVERLSPVVALRASRRFDDATIADMWFALNGAEFDRVLPATRMAVTYRDVLAGLGIRAGAQQGVTLDIATRAGQSPGAFCVAVRVPGEVVLSSPSRSGLGAYTSLLDAAGRSQFHAHTSPDVRVAFVRAGDGATERLFGHLFARLFCDRWAVAELFGAGQRDAIRSMASHRWMFAARRDAAVVVAGVQAMIGGRGVSGESFEEWMRSSLGVRVPGALRLLTVESAVEAAASLRARCAEVLLRDHLRVRFGTRWWRTRAAGDFLKEIWATGSEYSPEQLMSEIGLDNASLEALAFDVQEDLAT